MKLRLKHLVAAALLIVAAPALAEEPVHGGTLRYLVDPEPPTLVPIAHTAGATIHVSAKVTEGLLRFTPDLVPQPELATAWSISEDGLTYRFTIRTGVKWHDGEDLTPKDVAHSFELLKEYHPRGRNTFANVTDIAVDGNDVVLTLSTPAPYLLYALTAGESPIVPAHIYGDGDPATNPNGVAPIGTGPFVFKEWVRGSHILLARNENYWEDNKPYLDEVIIRFIPDANARVAALQSGEIDLTTGNGVALSQLSEFKTDPRFITVVNEKSSSPTQTQVLFNLDHEILSNIKVRQAIAHVIDRQALVDIAWYGYGKPSLTPIAPTGKYHADLANPYPLDFDRANALLDEAGYPRDSSGKRFALTLDYLPIQDGPRREGEYLKSQLEKLGVDVTIRAQDFATYVKRVYTDRDFEITTGLTGNLFDPTVGVQRLYWSKNFKIGLPFSNGSHYDNPQVDHLLEAASQTVDEAERRALFDEFQEIIATEIPEINLTSPDQIFVSAAYVRNYASTSDNVSSSFSDVYLAPH